MLDLNAVRAEIEGGLRNERDRLEQSRHNINFYRGEFDGYWPADEDGRTPTYPTPSLLMQWAVGQLGGLYSTGPAREVEGDKPTTDWLADLYAREGVDGLLQEADRLAIAADVAAIQVVTTGDPARPIRFALWPAHQFVAWDGDEDPAIPEAVATIDFLDNRRRLRLYTAESRLTFQTDKVGPGQTAGGTAYHFVVEEDNPLGVLPFAFAHASPPTTCFWTHGPGDVLQAVNAYVNFALTDGGEAIGFCRNPMLTEYGCSTLPPKRRPGSLWRMGSAAFDAASNGIPPMVAYLQPDTGFVEADWADLQGKIDHTLQGVNIPPGTFRAVQSAVASGVALVAEQLPVLKAIEARQRPFLAYERQLARVALAVGGMDPAKADTLRLRWPEVVPRSLLYGPDEDKADQADLDLGLTSRIQILMRRFNWTRDQAVAHLKQVAEDRDQEEQILPPPEPPPLQPAPPGQEPPTNGRPQPEAQDPADRAAD